MTIFKEKHLITYNDADENGRIQLPALISYMMQTSNNQLSSGGAGIQDFLAKGLGWVVVDYHLEIERLPKAGETVFFTTRANGYNRFFEYRDFGVETENGQKIIDVKSQWVVLDLVKRKILPTNPKLMEKFDNPELKKMPRFKRLRPLEKYDYDESYKVRYYDLDTNHHLTNAKYFDWMIDTLPRDFLNKHIPKVIDITFKKEVQYGKLAQAFIHLNKDTKTSYHEIKSDQEVSALAQISWQQDL